MPDMRKRNGVMMKLDELKKELDIINAKIIKLQTLQEQAQKECKQIEEKYGVSNIEELKAKYESAVQQRDEKIRIAEEYLKKVKEDLADV